MNAEERVLEAIRVTRAVLEINLHDSCFLVFMAANDVAPEAIEDIVVKILEYLEKTKEEEKPHG